MAFTVALPLKPSSNQHLPAGSRFSHNLVQNRADGHYQALDLAKQGNFANKGIY